MVGPHIRDFKLKGHNGRPFPSKSWEKLIVSWLQKVTVFAIKMTIWLVSDTILFTVQNLKIVREQIWTNYPPNICSFGLGKATALDENIAVETTRNY